jgi:xylulokinase
VAGDAVVAVDSQGNQLYPSIATPDERGRTEGEWLAEQVGGAKRLYELTGQPVDNMYALNRVLWFRTHMPEVEQRTWKWLCWHDFFVGKLGLPPTIDWSLAARTLGFDLRRRAWSPELLGAAGMGEDQLAHVAPAGTIIGQIPARIATELGLPTGVMAVTGGFDQACAALGAGAVRCGVMSIATGSVEVLAAPITEPVGEHADRLRESVFAQVPQAGGDGYLVFGVHFAAGTLVRWYRDTLARGGEYQQIDASLPIEPTRLLVLPHFAGSFTPRRDPWSTGAVLGLALQTTQAELGRAVLEGTAYELRRILELLEGLGISANELRAVGGGARSDVWLQIKADILNRTIVRPAVFEAGCLAGAILGAVGLGHYPDAATAANGMVQPADRFEPDARRAARYANLFAIYSELHPVLSPLSRRLADA